MICSRCSGSLRVIDTRHVSDNRTYREKKCSDCGQTTWTIEYEVIDTPKFVAEWRNYDRNKIARRKESED